MVWHVADPRPDNYAKNGEQLVIGLIAVVILLRYKALIPMMTLAYVIEHAGLVTAHTPLANSRFHHRKSPI